jgi:outer membrane protein assembly factor BamB
VLDLGGDSHFRSLSVDSDGTIYAGASSELFAVNPDGTIKWSVTIPQVPSHVTVSEDGFLYVQTIQNKMYKLESTSGDMVNDDWPYDFSIYGYVSGVYPAAIAENGTILCGTGGRPYGYLHAINPDGTGKWEVENGNNVETLPAIDEENNVVYFGNNKNQLTKVDLDSGTILKRISPGGHGYITSHIAIGDNGLIYFTKFTNVGDNKGYIYAYDSDLNEKWRTQLGTYWVIPPSMGYDGTIYTAGRNTGKLSALDPSTGIEKWSFPLDGDFDSPPVIDKNGTVYVVTKNYLYALIPGETSAQLLWSFGLEGNGYPQPAIVEDGTLYILSRSGVLTALGKSIKEVSIDIKPGSETNPINLKSGGNVPVAIFGTSNFDVATIDPSTVTMAGAPVKLKKKGGLMASSEDVNDDGIDDLVVHFETAALQLSPTDTEAILEGETFNGIRIRGTDTVRIISK